MKHFPMLVVAAVVAAAVSAPAQVSIEGRLGRHIHASVIVDGRAPQHRDAREQVRRHPVRQRGHWDTVHEQVLVPGYWREDHVPPTYGWIMDHCGHRHWGIVDPGGCRRVWVPARWETRCRQVWVSC